MTDPHLVQFVVGSAEGGGGRVSGHASCALQFVQNLWSMRLSLFPQLGHTKFSAPNVPTTPSSCAIRPSVFENRRCDRPNPTAVAIPMPTISYVFSFVLRSNFLISA